MHAVGQLAGGVAHDFNNVLQAIIGYSDLLLANHRPTDPSFQDIMQIKQNANRAASLVRQLLAFSRRQTLRPEVLNLGDLLSDLSMLLRRLLGERVDLDFSHGRDLWLVKADVNQFEQVVVNLAVNAPRRHAGRRPPLHPHRQRAGRGSGDANVAGMPAADYVVVEVEDTGTGIPPDMMDKIFEPFFTTKEVGKGTGLGLSTVFGIVKQSGGFIVVDSPRQGHDLPHLPAALYPEHEESCRGAETRAGAPAKKPAPRISPARARSSWSRTRTPSGLSTRGLLRRAATRCWRRPRVSRPCRSSRSAGRRSISSSPTSSCRRWTARPCSANCASGIRP